MEDFLEQALLGQFQTVTVPEQRHPVLLPALPRPLRGLYQCLPQEHREKEDEEDQPEVPRVLPDDVEDAADDLPPNVAEVVPPPRDDDETQFEGQVDDRDDPPPRRNVDDPRDPEVDRDQLRHQQVVEQVAVQVEPKPPREFGEDQPVEVQGGYEDETDEVVSSLLEEPLREKVPKVYEKKPSSAP